MKKLPLALLCVGSLILGTAACSFTAPGPDAPDNPGTAATETATIRLWHIYGSDSDPAARVLEQITKDAEAEFHVSIDVDTAENEDYKTKLKAAFAANELPDIFYTWGNEFLKPLVRSGKVLPLDSYLTEDFASRLNHSMMSGVEFDGNTYALPLDSSVAMLFINRELLEQYQLQPPETWDEFIHVCQSFIDQGITPLSVGGNEPWTIAMYYDLLALREVGPEGVRASAARTADYSDPGYLRAAEKLRQLVDMGAFPKNSAGVLREEAEALFLSGKAPMYLNGSWTCARVYKESSDVAGKIEVIPFPTAGSGRSTIYDFTGGPDSAFAVSSSAADPNLTVSIAQYLSLALSKELYKQGSNALPYIDVDLDKSEANPLLLDIRSYTAHASSYTIWWDNLLETEASTIYLNNLLDLFTGAVTPEEYISQMNTLQDIKGE